MKIGHPANKPPPTPAAGTPAAAADVAKTTPTPRHATTAAPADPSATVALSNTASTLLSSGANADFDAHKVDQISGAIAAGTFKVDHAAIADKLISNAQELLGKVKG